MRGKLAISQQHQESLNITMEGVVKGNRGNVVTNLFVFRRTKVQVPIPRVVPTQKYLEICELLSKQ
jgi:hypothetical protein